MKSPLFANTFPFWVPHEFFEILSSQIDWPANRNGNRIWLKLEYVPINTQTRAVIYYICMVCRVKLLVLQSTE